KSFMDIGLDNSTGHGALNTVIPVTILNSYGPDATVVLTKPANSPGMTVTKTFKGGTKDHFVMSNVTVTYNQASNTTLKVKTDVWASNSNAAGAKAQCYLCGSQQIFNDPTITGSKRCTNPRLVNIGISTTSVH